MPMILDAASVARLDKDVADFPDGYATMVGERGITLSMVNLGGGFPARYVRKTPKLESYESPSLETLNPPGSEPPTFAAPAYEFDDPHAPAPKFLRDAPFPVGASHSLELRYLFSMGGAAIIDGIAAQEYDVLRGRPVVTRRKKLMLLLGALVGKLRAGRRARAA